MSDVITFAGLHVIGDTADDCWYIHGEFAFESEDDYEEFKSDLQSAFSLVRGYSVPTILTCDEYAQMNVLPSSIRDLLEE